ncbi:MAG: hypothetical protein COC01_07205, partial [Bacteroidetes bacterium]
LLENAINGISTMRRGINFNEVWGYTGGIIIAQNSTFRNNRRAIEFMEFDGANSSFFQSCTFETTTELNDPAIKPAAFVSMWRTKSVEFRGNTFINSAPSGTFAFDERGIGLFAFDAGFIVEPFCNQLIFPCEEPNHFEGLYRGIDAATGTISNGLITIHDNEFEDMFQGVLLTGVEYAEVTDNDFEVRPNVVFNNSNMPYGLYLDDCTGYVVEGNEFENIISSNNCVGTFVRNSRDASNFIHSNKYDNLFSGIIALDDNDGDNAGDGLQFTCNKFTSATATFDMTVLGQFADGNIGLLQGLCNSINSPAGNQFSHSCSQVGSDADYYVSKMDAQQIYYFHHTDAITAPQPGCYNDNYQISLSKHPMF